MISLQNLSRKFWLSVCFFFILGLSCEFLPAAAGENIPGKATNVPKRKVAAYHAAKTPIVDGKLNEPLWKELPCATGFTDISKNQFVPYQTLFSVAYDDKNLYLGIFCEEPLLEKIKATIKEKDAPVYFDDSIEIFIDPEGKGTKYMHFVFNTLGTQYDGLKMDSDWNGNWSCAANIGSNGWSAEVAIPFSTLGVKPPKPGETYRINMARNRYTEKTNTISSWSVLTASFHLPEKFGELTFASPDTIPTRQAETEWNKDFLATVNAFGDKAVKQGGRELKIASRIPEESRSKVFQEKYAAVKMLKETLEGSVLRTEASREEWLFRRQEVDKLVKASEALAAELLKEQEGAVGSVKLPQDVKPGVSRQGENWFVSTREAVFAIDARTGKITGIWDKNKLPYVVSSYDLYTIETVSDTVKTDERTDRVLKTTESKAGLIFVCENDDLPGILIHKEYGSELDGKILKKRLKFEGSAKERTLVSLSSRTIFDESFRKPSYYNQVVPMGATMGGGSYPTVSASEVTGKWVRRAGCMQDGGGGWSQFLLLNPKTNTGIAQYLYKTNDRFVWLPFSADMSYWTQRGWDMAWSACFLEEDYSAEMRYHLFQGDRFVFHREYQALPEYVAVRKSYQVHPAISKMRYVDLRGQVEEGLSPNFMQGAGSRFYSPYRSLRSDEVMESYFPPLWTMYGVFPGVDIEDIVETYDKSRTPAADRKKAISTIKNNLPKFLLSTYWMNTGIHPDAPAFKEHPEFLLRDKAGKLVFDWSPYNSYQANFAPEYRKWFVEQAVKMANYMGYDFIYLDCGAGFCIPDWGSGRVLQSLDHMDFLKELHAALLKENKFIFINGDPGHLFVDMLYLEFMGNWSDMLTYYRNWRDRADIPMMYKLYQPEGTRVPVLSWQDWGRTNTKGAQNDREYTNLVLKLGLNVGGVCRYDFNEELKTEPGKGTDGNNKEVDYAALHYYEEAYNQGSLETAGTTILVDPDLEPAWWRDYETNIEAYALKQGEAHILTVTSHLPKKEDITLSASPGKMGLQKGKRTFLSRYTRRDNKAFVRKGGPPPEGWTRLFSDRKCESFYLEEGKIRIEFPSLEPEFTELVSLSQVSAFIYSVEGQMTQYILPETLGCKVAGSANEKRQNLSLDVTADKPLEIAAWWPKAWGVPAVFVDGKEKKPGDFIALGKESFILVSLEKGKSKVEIRKKTVSQ